MLENVDVRESEGHISIPLINFVIRSAIRAFGVKVVNVGLVEVSNLMILVAIVRFVVAL